MIIWGSKAKVHQVGSGSFFCPNCRTDAPYSHHRVSRYFTLYFIPLFPTQTLGEYVTCGICKGQLNSRVLSLTREQIEAALAPWTCPQCGNQNAQGQQQCLACSTPRIAQPPALPSAPLSLPAQRSAPPSAPREREGDYDY